MKRKTESTDRIDVSVIIPTHSRPDHLREALISIMQLTYLPEKFEVIVIDDNSTPGTETMVRLLQKEVKYKLIYKKMTRKNGISIARNLGMNSARGRIFVFSDDDCLFEPEWLQRITAPFSDPSVGAVGGPDRGAKTKKLFPRCVEYLFTSFIGTGGLRTAKKIRLGRYYPKGHNMAVSGKVISEIGGFNENLQPGEDIELGYRIEKAGYRLDYVEEAFVWHKRKDNLKEYLQKMYRMGYQRVVLGCLHPGLVQIGHFIPFLSLVLLLTLSILAPFSKLAFFSLLKALSVYLLAVFISAIQAGAKNRDIRQTALLLLLIPLHHFTHALGVLVAILKLLFKGKPKRKFHSHPIKY